MSLEILIIFVVIALCFTAYKIADNISTKFFKGLSMNYDLPEVKPQPIPLKRVRTSRTKKELNP
jgi:hypothetical protein